MCIYGMWPWKVQKMVWGWSGSEGLTGPGNTDPQIISETRVLKKFGPFSALFMKIGENSAASFSSPLRFFSGPFWVLRPKFRPLGNTETDHSEEI
jgi:hypothetical protein